jgi:hypothetical protein
MADSWNEGTWGQGFWGQQSSVTVSVTGLSTTTTLGTETFVGDVVVTLDSLQATSALGTAVGTPEHVVSVTPVTFETQLSGVTVGEGTGVVLPSLSMAFTTGTETASGSVDVGWGRAEWGSFEWNANIEFINNVSSVTMSTALGTPTVEVGSGVIVSVTGLEMTSALGDTTETATSLVTLDSLTIGAALSGASGIAGEGNVGVIAPSDQLDFTIGTPVIDIFTQVDSPSVAMTSALGTVSVSADKVGTLSSVAMNTALGTPTIEVGTGVIVSVSTVALSFATGTETATGGATVNVTGLDLSIVPGNPFSTPWANVVTGASNTWTEVDAA